MLFLQAKFGFTAAQAGQFYGFFLAGVYFMPLIGGILADKFGYGKMVTLGIVVMFLGYLLMAVPASGSVAMVSLIGALVLICVGTGLFKGNLQVMVGNLYDDPRYSAKRDSAFSIFYMAINIGAMYAPSAATAIANWQLKKTVSSTTPTYPRWPTNSSRIRIPEAMWPPSWRPSPALRDGRAASPISQVPTSTLWPVHTTWDSR